MSKLKVNWAIVGLVAAILALTALPPLWGIYLVAGAIGTFAAFCTWDVLILAYNLIFVAPQNMGVGLMQQLFHFHFQPWNPLGTISILNDNPHFGGFTFAIAILVWLIFVAGPSFALRDAIRKQATAKKELL